MTFLAAFRAMVFITSALFLLFHAGLYRLVWRKTFPDFTGPTLWSSKLVSDRKAGTSLDSVRLSLQGAEMNSSLAVEGGVTLSRAA